MIYEVKRMYKLIRQGSMPKFLKILLYLLLTITCVYWISYFLYKILECVRICINGITKEKGRWWFFLLCLSILLISICIALKFNPILELWDLIKVFFIDMKDSFINLLK